MNRLWMRRRGIYEQIMDAAASIEDPVEIKHSKMTRSVNRALVDPKLKPDAAEDNQAKYSYGLYSYGLYSYGL